MRLYLILGCQDQFRAKARYVFATFCKVLGLDLVEIGEDNLGLIPADVPALWYGAMADVPSTESGLICVHASPEASAFFASHNPRRVEDVTFVCWDGRRVPFLFAADIGRTQTGRLDSLLAERSDVVDMPYDFIASAFYFLSRWEETVIPERDRHGRFPYARSLAAQLGLPENIVDVYLDLFIALLNLVRGGRWPGVEIPTWYGGVPFVVCLTHDVDEISKSRLSRVKFVWDHIIRPEAGHRHTPVRERAGFALASLFSGRDPYWTFPALAEMERQFGCTASYCFQAGGPNGGVYYSLSGPRIRRFIDDLLADGFEIGLHGTYLSAFDENRFLREKSALAAITNQEPVGHRQHYLRMDYNTTLPIYERAGLQYDMTLGYAEHEGYRNQFSYPYHPYNHEGDRPYRFLELPTVIMDATLAGYRELPAARAWQVIEAWLERTCVRRGCITLLWHNPWDGVFPGYFDLYPRILTWIHDHGGVGLSGRDVFRQWLAR
jgi:peptidoglycan/xylan/chitin deacetylase (PgdA/CDA1 family)